MPDRAEGRRLHARQGRPAAPGDGQEEARGAGRRVRRLQRGDEGQRLLRRRDQDALGHPRPVLRLRVQQGAQRGVRRWSPTGPRTSRPTTRPSTWPRCSPACATTRTSRRSTSTSAAGWGSRSCRRTSTSPTANFTPVGTDIRFGLAAIRNVGANVVEAIVAAASEKGRVRRPSPTSCARCPPSSATSGPSSR